MQWPADSTGKMPVSTFWGDRGGHVFQQRGPGMAPQQSTQNASTSCVWIAVPE
jgi:hypothetical protein